MALFSLHYLRWQYKCWRIRNCFFPSAPVCSLAELHWCNQPVGGKTRRVTSSPASPSLSAFSGFLKTSSGVTMTIPWSGTSAISSRTTPRTTLSPTLSTAPTRPSSRGRCRSCCESKRQINVLKNFCHCLSWCWCLSFCLPATPTPPLKRP